MITSKQLLLINLLKKDLRAEVNYITHNKCKYMTLDDKNKSSVLYQFNSCT